MVAADYHVLHNPNIISILSPLSEIKKELPQNKIFSKISFYGSSYP